MKEHYDAFYIGDRVFAVRLKDDRLFVTIPDESFLLKSVIDGTVMLKEDDETLIPVDKFAEYILESFSEDELEKLDGRAFRTKEGLINFIENKFKKDK